jgi:hypothetical protein
MEDMISFLDMYNQLSEWSGIRLNANKCKITAFVQDLQTSRENGTRMMH